VSNQSIDLFVEACGATGPLQVSVEDANGQTVLCKEFRPPFLVAGRGEQADLPLDDPAVSKRHAYLQLIAGHAFCIDLGSRTGILWDGRPRRFGWLGNNQAVDIGPFTVRLLGDGHASSSTLPDWDPLRSHSVGQDPFPPVSVEIFTGGQKITSWPMKRVLALVGGSPDCKLRISGADVARFYCGLLRTPLGLWAIDLHGRDGISVNGTAVRWSRLDEGDELQVGDVLLRVRCHPISVPGAVAAPASESAAVLSAATPGEPISAAAGQEERDPLGHDQAMAAEVQRLREQLATLEGALAEAVVAGAQARAEEQRQWQAQFDARHQAEQKCHAAHAELEMLRQEVKTMRHELERALAESVTAHESLAKFEQEARTQRDTEERTRAEEQRQWHRQLDEAYRQSDDQAEALRQEREQTEQLRGQLTALEQSLAEVAAARDSLAKASQDARAQHHAEAQAAKERVRDEARQHWQARLEEAQRQTGQETEALHGKLAALEQSLADAAAAHDSLAKASQEAHAQHHAEAQAAEERVRDEARRHWQARLEEAQHQTGQETEALHGKLAALEQSLADAAAARDSLAKASQEAHAQRDSEERARAEERGLWQRQLDDARLQAGQELQAGQAETERLRQEGDALRKEKQTLLRQVDALTQEREHLTASASAAGSYQQEAEQRFRAAVAQFETLVEQIQSLRKEFQQSQQSQPSPQYQQLGSWGWVTTGSARHPQVWKEDVRRLEELGKEATAAQARAAEASAEAIRADYERQLAEAGRRIQEAAERADRLEAELREHRERVIPPPPPNPFSPEEEETTPSSTTAWPKSARST
jgi:hypothetical protein